MRKILLSALLVIGIHFSATAFAQSVKSVVASSNGVDVTVYSDDFAQRYEYTAPSISMAEGFVLVAAIKKAGSITPAYATGTIMYSGEWRRYTNAIFRGGDPAKFTVTDRNVGRCSSSRYSRPSCTLSEGFDISFTAADVKKYSQDGILAIQLRAQDTSTVLVNIPVSYIDAVNEAVGR